jgi:hypothetical protein
MPCKYRTVCYWNRDEKMLCVQDLGRVFDNGNPTGCFQVVEMHQKLSQAVREAISQHSLHHIMFPDRLDRKSSRLQDYDRTFRRASNNTRARVMQEYEGLPQLIKYAIKPAQLYRYMYPAREIHHRQEPVVIGGCID